MLLTYFCLPLACACGRHVERFITRNEDNAVNLFAAHQSSLALGAGVIKRMANSIRQRNHLP